MSLGENIKSAREAKGMSQTDLSRKCGISGGSISQYESGKCKPNPQFLQRIADALDTTPAALSLGVEDAKPVIETVAMPKPVTSETVVPPTERRIMRTEEPVRYNAKDKEDLLVLNLLIRHIQDLKICREDKRKIYKIANEIRCNKEANILFGEESWDAKKDC